MPVGKWFKDGKLPFNKAGPGEMNNNFIQKQIDLHMQGKNDNRSFLWNMWLLQKWHQK